MNTQMKRCLGEVWKNPEHRRWGTLPSQQVHVFTNPERSSLNLLVQQFLWSSISSKHPLTPMPRLVSGDEASKPLITCLSGDQPHPESI